MLNAVTALNVKLDQDHFPAPRYSSNLLTMAPAETVVYASIPNLSQALTEVQQVFVPKIQQNPTLTQWWQQNHLDQVIADMSTMSGYLGNEMVVAASLNSSGHPGQPVIMAELKQPGFEAFAQAEVAKLSTGADAQHMRIVTDPSAIGAIPAGPVRPADPAPSGGALAGCRRSPADRLGRAHVVRHHRIRIADRGRL